MRRGKGEAALYQGQRRRVAELRRDRIARRQVGRRRARILGAVEVLGGEHEVARLEPLGGSAMQHAPPLVQQRFVGAVADERVAEHELAAIGADEEVLDQEPAVVARAVEQMAQRIGGESLAENGGRLQAILSSLASRSMRAWTSAWIDPGRLDCAASPALSRSCRRKSGLPSARSTQLATTAAGIEDAWVASRRASSAFKGARSMPISGAPWSTVRQAPAVGSPAKRVVMTSSKGCRAASKASAARRSSVQASAQWMSSTIRRSGRTLRPRSPARKRHAATPARGGAHRRGEGAQRGRRRHVEQVVEEQLAVGGDRSGRGGAIDGGPTLVRLDRTGDAQEAARQATDRVPAGLRAEVEDGGGVAGKAERPGLGREFGNEP